MARPQRPVIAQIIPEKVSATGTDTRRSLVRASIDTITAGLMQLSELQGPLTGSEPPLSEIEGYQSLWYRGQRSYETMNVFRASNGFALAKLVQRGLHDFALGLTIPTDGSDPSYYRFAFQGDSQAVAPRAENLVGLDKIAQFPDATVEVLSFERNIIQASSTYWEQYLPKKLE